MIVKIARDTGQLTPTAAAAPGDAVVDDDRIEREAVSAVDRPAITVGEVGTRIREPETGDRHEIVRSGSSAGQGGLVTKIEKMRLLALPLMVRLPAPGPTICSRTGNLDLSRGQDNGSGHGGKVDRTSVPAQRRWPARSRRRRLPAPLSLRFVTVKVAGTVAAARPERSASPAARHCNWHRRADSPRSCIDRRRRVSSGPLFRPTRCRPMASTN